MSKRKSISKKVRFDVFKRDNFTCQYCGKKAPDVILEVDHIKPVSKGGTNGLLNLITSCFDCNRGKSDKVLSDNQTLNKELKQMEKLSERKEQIEMMFEWQNELLKQDDMIIEKIDSFIETISGYTLSDFGKKNMKKHLTKYSVDEIIEGLKASHSTYGDSSEFLDNLGKVLSVRRIQKKKPYMKDLFYIRGIMKHRFSYYDKVKALNMLVDLYENYNVPIKELKNEASNCANWSQFKYYYEGYVYETNNE